MGYTNVLPTNNTNTIGIYMRSTGSSLIDEVEDFDLEHMQEIGTEFEPLPSNFNTLEDLDKWLTK